jgi:hypothetical protein
MKPRTLRNLGLGLLGLCIVTLIASTLALAQNLAQRNVHTVRVVGNIGTPAFEYRGHEGTVERLPPLPAPGEPMESEREGAPEPMLRLTWRGQTMDFSIMGREVRYDDGLAKYKSWFGVMLLVEGADTPKELEARWKEGDVRARLVAAARFPAPGYDDDTWGLVRRQDWVYRIAELHPDGPTEEAIEVFEKTYRELDAIYAPSTYTPDEMIPATDGERNELLWLHEAMTQVTPPAQYRGRNKSTAAVIAEMGWPWPAAGGSVLGIVIACMMIGASTKGD